MLLTCERAECGIEFRARQVRRFCGVACSGLAHRRPPLHCLVCGKLLVGRQRVACCAAHGGVIGGMGRHPDSGGWDFGGDNSPERLRVLWDEGHSTAEIGRRMGITKNAVVGKAHRLDLPARPSPIRRDGVPRALGLRRRPVPSPCGPTLPALASAIVMAARKPPVPPSQPPQRAPETPVVPPAPKRRPEAETLLPRAGTPPRWGFCQYAKSDTKPYLWCGDPAVFGSPYCKVHDRLCRPRRSWPQAERESVAA